MFGEHSRYRVRMVVFNRCVRKIAKSDYYLCHVWQSVHLSVRMEKKNSVPTGRIFFNDIWYLSISQKRVQKIQILLNSDNNNWHFTWRPIHVFLIISRAVLLKMRNVSDKSCRPNQNTFYFKQFFFLENCAFYEIMWKNIIQLGRP